MTRTTAMLTILLALATGCPRSEQPAAAPSPTPVASPTPQPALERVKQEQAEAERQMEEKARAAEKAAGEE